jgi:hypothetical protein
MALLSLGTSPTNTVGSATIIPSTTMITLYKEGQSITIDKHLTSYYLSQGWLLQNDNPVNPIKQTTSIPTSGGVIISTGSSGTTGSNSLPSTTNITNSFDISKYLPYIIGAIILILILR